MRAIRYLKSCFLVDVLCSTSGALGWSCSVPWYASCAWMVTVRVDVFPFCRKVCKVVGYMAD